MITIFTRADLKIGLIHRLVILATINRLLISEDIVDHVANMYFITDDDRDAVEFVDEFFKLFPCFTLGEDGLQHLKIVARHCLRHYKGDSGSAMDPLTGNLLNAVGYVLQPGSNGSALSVNSFCRSCCSGVESLDLRFQSWRWK